MMYYFAVMGHDVKIVFHLMELLSAFMFLVGKILYQQVPNRSWQVTLTTTLLAREIFHKMC